MKFIFQMINLINCFLLNGVHCLSAGYYARVKGMHTLLDQFLAKTECNCQVVNLGAGFDSLFWLLKVSSSAIFGSFIKGEVVLSTEISVIRGKKSYLNLSPGYLS